MAWIEEDFAADPKLAADLRAYMAYALAVAGQADAGGLGQVFGPALEAVAVRNGAARPGAGTGEGRARGGDRGARWKQARSRITSRHGGRPTRDPMLDFSADATPEATAYAVKFLSHQRPDSPLLPKAALWLVNHRNEGYWWSSTKQTAMVIYGLTDYLKATGELKPNLTATVLVNDKPVLTQQARSGDSARIRRN